MPSKSPHYNGGQSLIDDTVYDIMIGDQKLKFGEKMNLAAGVKYKVTIERKTGSFKGLLFRLPLENVFTLNKNDENFQLSPVCDDGNSAVTHSNRLVKNKAEFYMKIPEEGVYKLDVTFVLQKLGASEWTDYTLNVTSLPSYCTDSPIRMKQGKNKKGKPAFRLCKWADVRPEKRCKSIPATHCPTTCHSIVPCISAVDSGKKFKVRVDGQVLKTTCADVDVASNKRAICSTDGMSDTCRVTCA